MRLTAPVVSAFLPRLSRRLLFALLFSFCSFAASGLEHLLQPDISQTSSFFFVRSDAPSFIVLRVSLSLYPTRLYFIFSFTFQLFPPLLKWQFVVPYFLFFISPRAAHWQSVMHVFQGATSGTENTFCAEAGAACATSCYTCSVRVCVTEENEDKRTMVHELLNRTLPWSSFVPSFIREFHGVS